MRPREGMSGTRLLVLLTDRTEFVAPKFVAPKEREHAPRNNKGPRNKWGQLK